MFRAKRRFDGDIGCKWENNTSLDQEFEKLLDEADFYVIRHWYLKCSSCPSCQIFFEKEDVSYYITNSVRAGDALEIWSVLEDKNVYIHSKMPDMDGLIPVSGCAY